MVMVVSMHVHLDLVGWYMILDSSSSAADIENSVTVRRVGKNYTCNSN